MEKLCTRGLNKG